MVFFYYVDENEHLCEGKCNVTMFKQDDGTVVYDFSAPLHSQLDYGECIGLVADDAVPLGGEDEDVVNFGSVPLCSTQNDTDEDNTNSTDVVDPDQACSVTRRRQRFPKSWKQNHRIIKRNLGESYRNSKGIVVKGKLFKAEHS